jgi:hypothetical protein
VIHVESTKHPDGIRLNTTRPMSEPQWWEWCPMFHGSNTNKLDVAIELDTERGRELFLDLVAHSDVVLEHFSPRVLEQLDSTRRSSGEEPAAGRARTGGGVTGRGGAARLRRPSKVAGIAWSVASDQPGAAIGRRRRDGRCARHRRSSRARHRRRTGRVYRESDGRCRFNLAAGRSSSTRVRSAPSGAATRSRTPSVPHRRRRRHQCRDRWIAIGGH